jgi:hypothetical protein
MAIDPKLYEKYTGKRPGDALTRMGQSLAQSGGKGSAGDTSLWRAYLRGHWFVRVGAGLLILGAVAYFLFAPADW